MLEVEWTYYFAQMGTKKYKFYQLIVTPADGVGKPNHVRWYVRDGEDRGTWKEYREQVRREKGDRPG